jgi:hypothetical protein
VHRVHSWNIACSQALHRRRGVSSAPMVRVVTPGPMRPAGAIVAAVVVVLVAACTAFRSEGSGVPPTGTSGSSGAVSGGPTVSCNDTACGPGTFCCRDRSKDSWTCVDVNGGVCPDIKIYCDETADCQTDGTTDEICCAETSQGGLLGAACAKSCPPNSPPPSAAPLEFGQLCNPGVKDECRDGKSCNPNAYDGHLPGCE